MKVTFEEQDRRLRILKEMCEEFPDDKVEEIQSKIIRLVGMRFSHKTVRQYLDFQKMKTTIMNSSFQKKEPFSDNEMDYGTTDFNVTFEQLSESEKELYLESL